MIQSFHYSSGRGITSYLLLERLLRSSSKRERRQHSDMLKEHLAEYLAYINANLVISHSLGIGFHDWCDFAPFYKKTSFSVGIDQTPEQKKIQKVKQLFELSFSEFTFWDNRHVITALKDKRIANLRDLVDKSCKEGKEFDLEYANRILHEVVGIEQRIGRFRKIVSYLTMPIGYIPWVGTPLQQGVNEVVGQIEESNIKKDYRWFYLISELSKDLKEVLSRQ